MSTGLKHTVSFNLRDQDLFINEFLKQVDTESKMEDYATTPWCIKSDYFGNIEWNKFKIFRLKRYFLQKQILLKITGEVSESKLTATIKFYYQESFLLSSIILAFLSFMLMAEINIYAGLILIILVAAQIAFTIKHYENGKRDFINLIERINKQ